MKTYQTLTLVGGIFGITITPIILFSLAAGMVFFSAFDSSTGLDPEILGERTGWSLIITIIVSIIAISIVFVTKKTKAVGYTLLGLAIVMLVATNISGIITWLLFFVGGISAIKYKGSIETKKINSPSDMLKERYAKGEISQKEFDKMKSELE